MNFGHRVRDLRLAIGLAQRDLAQRVGIDFTYLSKIENDKVPPPSEDVIRKLAEVFEVDPEELLTLAAKIDQDELREAVAQDERIGILFRKLQSRDFTTEQLQRMMDIATEDDTNA